MKSIHARTDFYEVLCFGPLVFHIQTYLLRDFVPSRDYMLVSCSFMQIKFLNV